jgi:hypothetical protein
VAFSRIEEFIGFPRGSVLFQDLWDVRSSIKYKCKMVRFSVS